MKLTAKTTKCWWKQHQNWYLACRAPKSYVKARTVQTELCPTTINRMLKYANHSFRFTRRRPVERSLDHIAIAITWIPQRNTDDLVRCTCCSQGILSFGLNFFHRIFISRKICKNGLND